MILQIRDHIIIVFLTNWICSKTKLIDNYWMSCQAKSVKETLMKSGVTSKKEKEVYFHAIFFFSIYK